MIITAVTLYLSVQLPVITYDVPNQCIKVDLRGYQPTCHPSCSKCTRQPCRWVVCNAYTAPLADVCICRHDKSASNPQPVEHNVTEPQINMCKNLVKFEHGFWDLQSDQQIGTHREVHPLQGKAKFKKWFIWPSACPLLEWFFMQWLNSLPKAECRWSLLRRQWYSNTMTIWGQITRFCGV